MKIKVILERDVDGQYVANVPKLPGYESRGRTINEIVGKIEKEIIFYINTAIDVSQYYSGNDKDSNTQIFDKSCHNKLTMSFRVLYNKFHKKILLSDNEKNTHSIH